MAVPSGYSTSVPSLPPPRPKSPPEYPDLYGKRRETAKVQMLEREIGFLEEELKSVDSLEPASRCCKEVSDFVVANADPLIPTNRKNRRSCRFWKWLCGSSCFNFSWICCGCCCTKCSCRPQMPRCKNCCKCLSKPCSCCSCSCSCPSCSCPSCFSCSKPKCPSCSCSCPCPCPSLNCFRKTSCSSNCCSCRLPSCPDCSCCCGWSWRCCWPKCPTKWPKVRLCCSCKRTCCNPLSCCLCF